MRVIVPLGLFCGHNRRPRRPAPPLTSLDNRANTFSRQRGLRCGLPEIFAARIGFVSGSAVTSLLAGEVNAIKTRKAACSRSRKDAQVCPGYTFHVRVMVGGVDEFFVP